MRGRHRAHMGMETAVLIGSELQVVNYGQGLGGRLELTRKNTRTDFSRVSLQLVTVLINTPEVICTTMNIQHRLPLGSLVLLLLLCSRPPLLPNPHPLPHQLSLPPPPPLLTANPFHSFIAQLCHQNCR